ncbi:MAG: (Fe-S)-binding protein [Halodesulfovibrio sp.]
MSGKKAALNELLKLVQEETHKCIRCGECRTVCPVFREEPAERYTARGKIAIAEELAKGNIELTPHVREAFDNCLLCTGCASQCSSGARADKVIMAVRRAFRDELGLPPVKKLLGLALTRSGKTLDMGARIGAALQPLLFKGVPEDSGLLPRFALPLVDGSQYVPKVAEKSFRSRVKRAGKDGLPRVTFFTGCMANYAMTEIADSVVKVLTAVDVTVTVPEKQGCCGMPMLASGDADSVRTLAERNIEALSATHGPIVVACASCGHMLQHGYREILGEESPLCGKADDIAARTVDITRYLVQEVGVERLGKLLHRRAPETVTYHDPCHLRKAQGITEEPRTLLELIPHATFREMPHPEACCGLGGTYCISFMERSKSIQTKKIDDARTTGADCIATACPGCIMQLRDGIRRSPDKQMRAKHVIELLADAL